MDSKPLVTIVTPSFNQAQFLEKTICSVLDQGYDNIEYLVADGGSTDGSVEIIRKYEKRIAWWVSEKDNGQADAINKGLSRANGEIVAWINSDDYYMPGAVEQAVKTLNEHPEVGFVFADVRVIDKDGKTLNNITYGDWSLPDLMSFHIIAQPTVFMRRSVLEKTGLLDLNYHLLLDHQLWIRLAKSAKMLYVPELWASAHYHEDCKNLAMAAEFGREAFRIVEWMKQYADLKPLYQANRKKIEAGAHRLNAFYLLDAKQYRASFQAYWKALLLNPAVVGPEWYRMLYALFAPLGLDGLKSRFLQRRRNKLNR